VAGRPADEPALGRLLREASALQPEDRARLALALQRRGRPLPQGLLPAAGEGGSLGALARRGAGLPGDPSPLALPPPGAPQRAEALAHLRAAAPARPVRPAPTLVYVNDVLVDTLDLGAAHDLRRALVPGDRVRVEGGAALVERGGLRADPTAPPLPVRRWAQAEDGAPLRALAVAPDRLLPGAPTCGAAEAPCLLRLGEALSLPLPADLARASGPAVPAGLALRDQRLVAQSPGTFVVTGLLVPAADGRPTVAAPLHVRVLSPEATEAPTPLQAPAALSAAAAAAARGQDPRPLLAAWPAFDDWDAAARPEVMKLRWAASAGDGPAERVAAFEALRDAAPGATLSLAEVAGVAQAYAAVGQTTRALQVQRAGLSAAFLAEAAPLRRLEPITGALVSLQAMRELVDRSPGSATADEAEFHLAAALEGLADSPPAELLEQGMGAVDLRLLAAAWDREFLAFHPSSPLRAQAGFQLARGLVQLGAFAEAARWAAQVAEQSPADPALDALRLTEAVARMELGQDGAAQRILLELSTGDWPLEGGGKGPSGLAGDAAYALARAHEAAGRVEAAIQAYSAVAGAVPEAGQAAAALRRVRLELPALVRDTPGGAAEIDVVASNLDKVDLRAYRLDLRTLFLRDGGLSGAADVAVAGVSPAWSGERALRAGPYPEPRTLSVPLPGPGAYLVQVSGGGVEARSLVVLSALQLTAEEGPAGSRVVVRRGGQPAGGVELRALGGGAPVALRADARGVALAPSGSLVFAFDGEHVAFTDPSQSAGPPRRSYAPPAAPAPDLLQNLERRMKQQQERNEAQYDELYQPEGREGVDANAL
jgi:tetratricopeptide (TPR) repeat protein